MQSEIVLLCQNMHIVIKKSAYGRTDFMYNEREKVYLLYVHGSLSRAVLWTILMPYLKKKKKKTKKRKNKVVRETPRYFFPFSFVYVGRYMDMCVHHAKNRTKLVCKWRRDNFFSLLARELSNDRSFIKVSRFKTNALQIFW